ASRFDYREILPDGVLEPARRSSADPDNFVRLPKYFSGMSIVSEADAIQAALDRRSAWMTANAQRMWDDPDCRNWAGFVPPA
ncbi:MAG: hypothetical protein H0W42_11475, partial [Gemmatimonadaceae bacterium]|nr:hypothetical protein [Gemmatimonadaceae bacterium]